MKRFAAALVWACVPLLGYAQAPESVADTVLVIRLAYTFGNRTTYHHYRWIKDDGTYQSLWSGSERYGGSYFSYAPSAGAVKYQRVSASVGRITFEGNDPLNLNVNGQQGPVAYDLTFAADGSGGIAAAGDQSLFTGTGSFTLRKAQSSGVANVSTRTRLAANTSSIVGFVLPHDGARLVLVRAVGATLARYGVSPTAGKMRATLFSGAQPVAPINPNPWSESANSIAAFTSLFATTGAIPLESTAGEECFIADLTSGAYTVAASSAEPGEALVEVYFLP